MRSIIVVSFIIVFSLVIACAEMPNRSNPVNQVNDRLTITVDDTADYFIMLTSYMCSVHISWPEEDGFTTEFEETYPDIKHIDVIDLDIEP